MNMPPANIPGLNNPPDLGVSVFLMGDLGTRKTTWAAQWPAPVFLSIRSEGGDLALRTYPQIAQWMLETTQEPYSQCPPVFNAQEPPFFPILFSGRHTSPIAKKQLNPDTGRPGLAPKHCMLDVIDLLMEKADEWGVCTVVIDSLTYLIDMWITDLVTLRLGEDTHQAKKWRERAEREGGEVLIMADWGMLNMYTKDIQGRLSRISRNQIWVCLENPIYESDPNDQSRKELVKILPLFPGKQSAIKLPGACSLNIHATKAQVMDFQRPGQYRTDVTFHTSSTPLVSLVRHRFGFAFPEGKLIDPEWGTMPTFRAAWAEIHPYVFTGRR